MELVIFIGLQASGKSNFYRARFISVSGKTHAYRLRRRWDESEPDSVVGWI
ncbi:MAG: hypothetical protein QNJ53_20000 [Pleurocapsa sp. MO_192.B19]|nr:hypothetical protein [Pleurocapsa sp. MO_192.B19]